MNIKSDNIYFTSDTHYAHQNICRGVTKWNSGDVGHLQRMTRDYLTIKEMNDAIINNINDSVGEDDVLVHLGDWSFGGFEKIEEFRNRINCKNIHLVLGNHDQHIGANKGNVQDLFLSVNQYVELELLYQGTTHNMVLMHYPITSWNHMNRGNMMLFGHVHSDFKGPGRTMDVGIDKSPGFKPYSFQEILDTIGNNPIKSGFNNDHHSKDVK